MIFFKHIFGILIEFPIQ